MLRYLLIFFVLFVSACTSQPQVLNAPSSENISLDNASLPTPTSLELNNTESPDFAEQQRERQFFIKGGGIFDFHELTGSNCDEYIITYRELLDETEDDVDELQQELIEEQLDVQEARTALTAAQQNGNERAIDRANKDIDDEEEDADYVENIAEEKTEYLRKLKIVFATMKEECPLLKAGK